MKSIKIIFPIFLVILFLNACQDKWLELADIPSPSDISFRVIQPLDIDEGGNTVILINDTPGTVIQWDYGTGRSVRAVDTVRFPFEGEYEIKMKVITKGGTVEMPEYHIEVTQNNFSYISDPLWEYLSGGVGNEKVWLLDFDEDGVSKYFNGPMYFSRDDLQWGGDCAVDDGEWCKWEADVQEWMEFVPGDYGTMTFNLIGGAYVEINHKITTDRGIENGSYFLDVDRKILVLNDVAPLQNPVAHNDVASWSTGYLISLTEDYMQIAYKNKDKDEFIIFNYISKEYNDNWNPGEAPECVENGDFSANNDNWRFLAGSESKTWVLDHDFPVGWASYEWNSCDGGWNYMPNKSEPISWGMSQFAEGSEIYSHELTFNRNNRTATLTVQGDDPDMITGDLVPGWQDRIMWIGSGIINTSMDVQSWNKVTIYTLTADELKLAVRSGEKEEFVVFTYVPK